MQSFVKVLEEWLADHLNASILSWNEDGTGFKVKNPEKFMRHVYSSRFSSTKYNSFKRQLNLYGFRSRDELFFHPYFQRGFVDYERILKRKGGVETFKVKAEKKREPEASKAEQQKEPDLFEFDDLHLCSTAGLVDLFLGLDF